MTAGTISASRSRCTGSTSYHITLLPSHLSNHQSETIPLPFLVFQNRQLSRNLAGMCKTKATNCKLPTSHLILSTPNQLLHTLHFQIAEAEGIEVPPIMCDRLLRCARCCRGGGLVLAERNLHMHKKKHARNTHPLKA